MLLVALGRLLAKPNELAERPTPPTATDHRIVAAQLAQDLSRWDNEVSRFVTVEGLRFDNEFNEICQATRKVRNILEAAARNAETDAPGAQELLKATIKVLEADAISGIEKVPIDWAFRMLDRQTPFSAHLLIRDAIGTAKTRLHIFDRYLDTDFFELYLRHVPRTLQIRLVTIKGKPRDHGVEGVRSVSALVSAEFADYQLLQVTKEDLHDRNLRVDDLVFTLGSSLHEAGCKPTNFGPGDSSPTGHRNLDDILSRGVLIT